MFLGTVHVVCHRLSLFQGIRLAQTKHRDHLCPKQNFKQKVLKYGGSLRFQSSKPSSSPSSTPHFGWLVFYKLLEAR